MSIFDQMESKSKEISKLLNTLLEMDNDELYGENRLHDISFKVHGIKQFKRIFGLLESLRKCDLSKVPFEKQQDLDRELNEYRSILSAAERLTLEDQTPRQTRDEIVNKVEQYYLRLYKALQPVMFLAKDINQKEVQSLKTEFKSHLKDVKKQSESFLNQLEKRDTEAQKVLQNIKKVAAEGGVEKTSFHFSQAEEEHHKKADYWFSWGKRLLLGLVFFVSLFVAGLLCFKSDMVVTFGYLEAGFLIITSLWFYAVIFCKANYEAEKHNEITNANKAKALKTFRAFVDGADAASTKDAMLLLAGNAAFYTPASGFRKNEKEVPLPPIAQTAKHFYKGEVEN